jgi:hypothetical protein
VDLEMAKYKFHLTDLAEGIEGATLIAFTVMLSPLLKSWYRGWGTTNSELNSKILGDDLVPNPKMISTRAVTIRAPASQVWPLLMQFGLKRGGWYSYDLLEAIGGAADFVEGHSARRIVPELQDLKIGDKIWMHPRIMPLTVMALEPKRSLVFLTRVNLQSKSYFEIGDSMPEQYVNSSWTFVLNNIGDKSTRLVVRSRLGYNPNAMNAIAWRVFTDPISFVMERKMLTNIKRIAESSQ